MKKIVTSIAIIGTICLAGCSTNTQTENTVLGAGTGAVVGGVGAALFHANPAAIAVTAVAGAVVGGLIGSSMESSDHTTMSKAMASDRTTTWTNTKTGTTYTVIPSRHMMTYHGNPNCRRFQAIAMMRDGKRHKTSGIACVQSDGSWKEVK